ncbi:ComEA family DNA-binding protein [Buchananella felis]|uniref:helix-hairpin-helix domain-containing protein n=1 Tax=Buchananella felis TaxID=3231492 RepID=UPI0035296CFA
MENKLAELKALAMKAAAVEEIDAPPRRSRLFPTARAAIGAAVVLCALLAAMLAYFRWFAPQVDDVALAAPAKSSAGLETAGEKEDAPGGARASADAAETTAQTAAQRVAGEAAGGARASAGAAETAAAQTGAGERAREVLAVHVAGAVASPGVYSLPVGARVVDAIAAAGGALPEADPNAVNLARFLRDGERVVVPRPGESVVEPAGPGDADSGTGPGPGAAGGASAGGASAGGVGGALVNINAASAAQLEELPGIGPSLAGRIVTHREKNGPFQSVQGLLDVPGIGPAKFEALREFVSVD